MVITDEDMRHITLFFIWQLLHSCNVGSVRNIDQNNSLEKKQNSIIENQLSKLFAQGNHAATITTYKQPTVEQKQVLKKFLNTVRRNEKLQVEFNALLTNPESINSKRLSQTLRLSEKQTRLFISIFSKETSTEKGTVSIFKNENLVSFNGKDQFSFLDSLVINLSDSFVTFRQSKLDFYQPDSSYKRNKFLPPGESLQSIYAFNGPNNLTGLLPISDRYYLVVARLSNSGKTYLYFKTHEQFSIDRSFDQFYSIIFELR